MCDSCKGKEVIFPIEKNSAGKDGRLANSVLCCICYTGPVTHYEWAAFSDDERFFCAKHIPDVTKYPAGYTTFNGYVLGQSVSVDTMESIWESIWGHKTPRVIAEVTVS